MLTIRIKTKNSYYTQIFYKFDVTKNTWVRLANTIMSTEKFNIAILPLQDKLFRFALSILKSEANAEDALQEVLVKLWELRGKLQKCNNVEAYAMKITKNYCIDRLRRVKNISEIKDEVVNGQVYNTEKQTDLKDIGQFAYQLINQLPPMQQLIMRLRDVEGYGLDEIAEIMEMKPSAVRANLSRARQTVRDELIKIQEFNVYAKVK